MDEKDTRLAKNTIYLYLRMGIGTIVSLYTSRIVLEQLGIDGFGVYTVVASVVVSLGFLSNSLSGALSRFFAFELGRENHKELRNVFNASLRIELCIGIILLLLLLTLGMWFIEAKLSIPGDDKSAAKIVLLASSASFFITILLVPYKSAVIAREQFGFFAAVELVQIILKLGVAFLLMTVTGNKLIVYSILIAAVISLGAIAYAFQGTIRLYECKISRNTKFKDCKPILRYAGIDLFGHFCGVISPQSIQWVVNVFFGVALNAALGVTNQVSGAVTAFVSSMSQAFRPQIIKEYSAANYGRMQNLADKCSVFVILLMGILVVPLSVNMSFVLKIWLKDVPEGTTFLCILALFASIPLSLTAVANCIVHASGRIVWMSVINGSLYLIIPIVSYVMLRAGFSYYYVFIIAFVAYTMQWFTSLIVASVHIDEFSGWRVIRSCIAPVILYLITLGICFIVARHITNEWVTIPINIVICLMSFGIYALRLYKSADRD